MLFASLVFSAGVNAQWVVKGPSAPQLAVFDTLMHNFMTSHGVTSPQLAMTRHGRLVLAHGYSLNPGSGDIVTDYDSTFRIASVSKQITSILVNRLLQEGRLSPSDTLGQFFNLTPARAKQPTPGLPTSPSVICWSTWPASAT